MPSACKAFRLRPWSCSQICSVKLQGWKLSFQEDKEQLCQPSKPKHMGTRSIEGGWAANTTHLSPGCSPAWPPAATPAPSHNHPGTEAGRGASSTGAAKSQQSPTAAPNLSAGSCPAQLGGCRDRAATNPPCEVEQHQPSPAWGGC